MLFYEQQQQQFWLHVVQWIYLRLPASEEQMKSRLLPASMLVTFRSDQGEWTHGCVTIKHLQ